MIQFLVPDIMKNNVLPPTESAHCSKVLRLKVGDSIICTDGLGNRYVCKIIDNDRNATKVEIISSEFVTKHWRPQITLAVAPTKNADRIEWLVEKAVEVGVDKIVILSTERTQPGRLKFDRLERIIQSAMNQSLKTFLPELSQKIEFSEFVSSVSHDDVNMMCYCDEQHRRKLVCEVVKDSETNINILIGPEGDFSPQEAQKALAAGFTPISLGDTRLRTETAALFALSQVHTILQIITNP